MRVLLLHKVCELLLELISDKDPLWPIAELDECLQYATPIVLVAQLRVLLPNGVDALLDDLVFLFVRDFFLLHQESVVRDSQFLD